MFKTNTRDSCHTWILLQLGFKGVRGDAYDSDMALDDISISPGECLEKTAYYGKWINYCHIFTSIILIITP